MFFNQRQSQMPKCLSIDAQHAPQGDYPSGDPSSRWITSKWCNVILVLAASPLMFWELPGHVCTTMGFLHPQSLPWENDRSEGLHVPLSLVTPLCWCSPVMKNITSATPSWVEKPSLNTCHSLSVGCFFPLFSSICVLLQGTLVERPIYRTSVNHSHGFCACRCVTVHLWACLLSCVNMHVCQYVSWSEYCLGVFIIYYNAWH